MSNYQITTAVAENTKDRGYYEIRIMVSRDMMEYFNGNHFLLRDTLCSHLALELSACFNKSIEGGGQNL
jgi:hypothetical protein